MTRYEIIRNGYFYYLNTDEELTVCNSDISYWNGLPLIDVIMTCMVWNYGFRKLPKE